MADFKNFNPAETVLVFKGHIITGFASGTHITAERDTDAFTDDVGADGFVTRVRSNDERGTITVTLVAASPSNQVLNNLMVIDQVSGRASGNLELVNLNDTTLIGATDAWIMKPANYESGDSASNREWKIRCAALKMFIGAAVF